MNVILVDTNIKRLHSAAALLRKIAPESTVMSTADPLMAAKYAFNNPVDLLFAALNMKRMSGLQLAAFVREQHPAVRACLLASRQEFADCPEAFDGGIRPLALPITEEALRKLFLRDPAA